MSAKLLVFDTHPVQYRVPIWKAITKSHPGLLHVIYASDFSVRGQNDIEFGQKVVWDEPMLEGYKNTILNCEKGVPTSSWGSFTGEGVAELIKRERPTSIFLMGLNYRYDMVAYVTAKRLGIPLWLRCETQDFAGVRSKGKDLIRSSIYRILYRGISRFFYIGELNKKHYLAHGVSNARLTPARYCTPDRFTALTNAEKSILRNQQRQSAGIDENALVIGFSGKFIEKKNPKILFSMLEFLPADVRKRIHLYFMGSGELEGELKKLAASEEASHGNRTYFSGFVNQTQLPAHYLAMDIMVLPSRRMGETWGLVCNEAMQSGASVIASDAVGSSEDFKTWARFRVFPDGEPKALANAVASLAPLKRDFDWASPGLQNYTIEAVAKAVTSAVM